MTESSLEHLNLRGWPFNIVPTSESARVWVGRADALRQARQLVRSAERVDAASLVLLWASFGSGKTHLLRHMAYRAAGSAVLVPVYVAVPQGIRSFVELYRALIDAMLSEGYLDAIGELEQRTDLERAVARIARGSDEQRRVAASWLAAERTPARDLRDVGIGRRIETTADAVNVLTELAEVFGTRGRRLFLLIDEVQELAEMGRNLADAVGGLHKLFDKSRGTTLVLSFTTATHDSMKQILGEALADRASALMTLPGLDADEAADFVMGLIEAWSIDAARSPFPFERNAIVQVVDAIVAERHGVTPRMLIRQFNRILRQADLDIEDAEIAVIDAAYALRHRGDDLE